MCIDEVGALVQGLPLQVGMELGCLLVLSKLGELARGALGGPAHAEGGWARVLAARALKNEGLLVRHRCHLWPWRKQLEAYAVLRDLSLMQLKLWRSLLGNANPCILRPRLQEGAAMPGLDDLGLPLLLDVDLDRRLLVRPSLPIAFLALSNAEAIDGVPARGAAVLGRSQQQLLGFRRHRLPLRRRREVLLPLWWRNTVENARLARCTNIFSSTALSPAGLRHAVVVPLVCLGRRIVGR